MAIQYKLEQLNHVQLIGVLRKYESGDEMQKRYTVILAKSK
ncbi:hypothetical protein [Staphylococcus haemolyticus]|nr:hypothetical protein [Staphylococcus haemolyticus]